VQVDRRFGGLWVVENGKIASWVTYLTPKEAVRAAKELLGGEIDKSQIKRRTGPTAAPEIAAPAPEPAAEPVPAEPAVTERPRNRPLTKSEEQKRAARARAKLRRRSSRQTA
jgi:hypothetical protein